MNYRYIAQQLRHIMQEIDDARTNCELIDNIDDTVFNVDISDLITGKLEVVSPGYKGEVNNS